MNITILYFASLREAVKTDRESVQLPANVVTAAHLRAWLITRGGEWSESFAEGRAVRVALDRVLVSPATPLRDGAEVAFFPPVTGG